jgi:mRNA-decapping enzyme subunit 2
MGINQEAYEEALDDVHTRFILNLPDDELASPVRIFFQLEQAWWFYDDFICDGAAAAAAAANAASSETNDGGDGGKKKKAKKQQEEQLPRFKHMKPFSKVMFEFSPLLQPMLPKFDKMYEEFSFYKRSISTYGTILLNKDATKVALCRNWQGKSWTLPGGKVNQNETGKDAAARETYEETGFDPESERGMCAVWKEMRERGEVVEELEQEVDRSRGGSGDGGEWKDEGFVPFFGDEELPSPNNYGYEGLLPWEPLQDGDKLIYTESDTKKRRTCFICRGVPETFPFDPVARKEVSEVAWHDLNSLPKHTYAVLPFLGQLRRWIKRDNRKRGREDYADAGGGEKRANSRAASRSNSRSKNQTPDPRSDTPSSRKGSAPKQRSSPQKNNNRDRSRGKQKPRSDSKEVEDDDPLVQSALASPGESNRWTEEEMFATNERILGRKVTYDGNPHEFAEKGFGIVGEGAGRVDPHAFRVVGGNFMNSNDTNISAPPDVSALQPLAARVRSGSRGSSGAGEDDDDDGLVPFFSEENAIGSLMPSMGAMDVSHNGNDEAPQAVLSAGSIQSNSKGLALLSRLRLGGGGDEERAGRDAVESKQMTTKQQKSAKSKDTTPLEGKSDENQDWFLTDNEITARSQKEKLCLTLDAASPSLELASSQNSETRGVDQDEHLTWMKQWASNLPRAPATKEFGDFHFDVNTIMSAMTIQT